MIFYSSKFDFRKQKCIEIRSKIIYKIAWLNFVAKTLPDASKTLTGRPKKLSDLPQDAPPDALRCLQDAPKTPQDDPKTTPRRPKTPPRQPKSHKSTQNQNIIDFYRFLLPTWTS